MRVATTRVTNKTQIVYSSLNLARKVRVQTTVLIQDFDANKNGIFEEDEIINMLKVLIQADETELRYVTSNMFRYDRDGDGVISCQELINFFLEVSWGEIAIQRLHRKGYYKNGSARMIEIQQFFATMKYILSFISLETNQQEMSALYKDIDSNNDGLISYNEYFTFLRTYFGSQSQASNEDEIVKVPQKPSLPEDLIINSKDRLRRLVISQSKLIFIGYNVTHNLRFSKEEVKSLLEDIFQVLPINVQSLVQRLANLNNFNDFQQLTNSLVLLQFGQLALSKLHNDGLITQWRAKRLSREDFGRLIRVSCSYMNVLPDKQLIYALFEETKNQSSTLSYSGYRDFIMNLFSSSQIHYSFLKQDLIDPVGFIRQKIVSPKPRVFGENKLVVDGCWRQLEKIFKKYDLTGAGVAKAELAQIISVIFRNSNQHQKNVLVWSALNSVDSVTIKFADFAPWVFKKLFHYGLVSFYDSQNSPKTLKMSVDQFRNFIKSTFWFLPSELEPELAKLYDVLNQNKQNMVQRDNILSWVVKKLCQKQ